MKPQSEKPKISGKIYLVSFAVILCSVIQVSYVKTAYNVPYRSLLDSFNKSWCFSGSGCEGKKSDAGSVVFWSAMAAAEPLGAIPAVLTGRRLAEAHGRTTVMTLSIIPITAGVALQWTSGFTHSLLFLPFGRLLQSFGATWLLIAATVFILELLYPRTTLFRLYCTFQLCCAAAVPLIQVLGLEMVLGTRTSWPWLNGVSVVSLVVLIFLTILPETPRYLIATGGSKVEVSKSLQFYADSTDTADPLAKQLSARCIEDWDRKRGFFVLGFIRKNQPHQLVTIRAVIACEVAQTLLMSNILFFMSTAAITNGTPNPNLDAQIGTVCIFAIGSAFALLSFELKDFVRKRALRLSCLAGSILCMLGIAIMAFFDLKVYFHIPVYGALLATYYLGLGGSGVVDVAESRLISVALGPTLIWGSAIAKIFDVAVSMTFLPILASIGPGYAWIPTLVLLTISFVILVRGLPHRKELLKWPQLEKEQEEEILEPTSPNTSQLDPGSLQPQWRTRAYSATDKDIVRPMPGSRNIQSLAKTAYDRSLSQPGGRGIPRQMSRSQEDLPSQPRPKVPLLIFPDGMHESPQGSTSRLRSRSMGRKEKQAELASDPKPRRKRSRSFSLGLRKTKPEKEQRGKTLFYD